MSDALGGIGTLLKMGDGGSPESFTTIAKVRDITGPGLNMDIVDVTAQDSPGHTEEVIPTLKRLGEITFAISYIPTDPTHNASTGLISKWVNRTKTNFQLSWPDLGATTWSFAGYISKLGPKAMVAGALTQDVGIRLAGAPSLA